MDITIRIRSVYGQFLFDPVCVKAKIFADITGKKTLTREALSYIAALGYSIKVDAGDVPEWLSSLSKDAN
jgi:hypothetical protein